MNSKVSIALATWMLKHLTFEPCNEALLGDLLEEFRGGRTVGWYWRQVLCAIQVALIGRFRNYALPLIFSIVWSMFYPACWLCIVKIPLVQRVFERWSSVDLPYSTSLQGLSGIISAVVFVWLGLSIYLMLRTGVVQHLSWLCLFASLSISFNVLFMTTIGLWAHLNDSGVRLSYVSRENLYFNSHLVAIVLPLVLSLLSAISFAVQRTSGRRHDTASIAG